MVDQKPVGMKHAIISAIDPGNPLAQGIFINSTSNSTTAPLIFTQNDAGIMYSSRDAQVTMGMHRAMKPKKPRKPTPMYNELTHIRDLVGQTVNPGDVGILVIKNQMVPVRFRRFDQASDAIPNSVAGIRVFYDRLDDEGRGAAGKPRQTKYDVFRVMRIDGVEKFMGDLIFEYMTRFSDIAKKLRV